MAERREEDETARAGHLHRSGRQSLDCAGRLDCRCASIPRAFWSVIGGPLEGQYRNASVFHDVACDQKIAAMENGAPNVLQRDAMQRRQRDQGEDNVLRGLQFWAVLGSWLCCDANVRRRCKTEI